MTYKLISDSLDAELNKRIKVELDSAQIYKAMGSWCRYSGFNNVAKFFFKHAAEEIDHSQKVIDYIDDKNCIAVIPQVDKPDTSGYSDIKVIFDIAMKHEMSVTKSYNDLATSAIKEGDHDVYRFAQTVLNEQVEELKKFRDILDIIDLNSDNPNLNYILEHEAENF